MDRYQKINKNTEMNVGNIIAKFPLNGSPADSFDETQQKEISHYQVSKYNSIDETYEIRLLKDKFLISGMITNVGSIRKKRNEFNDGFWWLK